MAVFVFGAGATRGASWVDPKKDPCIPPLDQDFFTQLQRVPDSKHRVAITAVMKDVVGLFGNNFDASLETVFSTVEHARKMLDLTEKGSAKKKKDLVHIRERLLGAIAAVFEAAMTKNRAGGSSYEMEACEHHDRFVREVLHTGDSVISFNYDCLLDLSLKREGSEKWCARYGYGFHLGARGKNLSGDDFWDPELPASKTASVRYFKLHGSLNFQVTKAQERTPTIKLKARPYVTYPGRQSRFSIIPPEWYKAYDTGFFPRLWQGAAGALRSAEHLILVGYSLPLTDLHATSLLRTSQGRGKLKALVVVNPDRVARQRTRAVLTPLLGEETRVLSFDYLPEFLACKREVWEI